MLLMSVTISKIKSQQAFSIGCPTLSELSSYIEIISIIRTRDLFCLNESEIRNVDWIIKNINKELFGNDELKKASIQLIPQFTNLFLFWNAAYYFVHVKSGIFRSLFQMYVVRV